MLLLIRIVVGCSGMVVAISVSEIHGGSSYDYHTLPETRGTV
jgi:hypothetical protein